MLGGSFKRSGVWSGSLSLDVCRPFSAQRARLLRSGSNWHTCSTRDGPSARPVSEAASGVRELPPVRPGLLPQPGDGADRAAGPVFDLEREADELEAALADEFFHVHEAFDMREAKVATDVVHLEVVEDGRPRG